jgi:hypothetical protein
LCHEEGCIVDMSLTHLQSERRKLEALKEEEAAWETRSR